MSFSNYDSLGTHKFTFSLDGITSKTIKSVDGLQFKLDKVETKSVNGADGKAIHKAWAGNKVYLGELTVTRVMTDDDTWDEWYNAAVKDVKTARKHGSITIHAQDGSRIREYTFRNAWPTGLKVTQMNAAAAAAIEETVTFVYEEMETHKL